MAEKRIKIGRVIESDTGTKTVKIHLHAEPKDVYIGMPLVVDTPSAKFFCMIMTIYQEKNPSIMRFSRRKDLDPHYGIDPEMAGSFDFSPFDIIVEAQCFKIIENHDGDKKKHPFKTIPDLHSEVFEATSDEITEFYVTKKWKDYWIGMLASNEHIPIPFTMEDAIQKPMLITGGTGSGKTVATKNLCKTIIHDPSNNLKAAMIIFDIQNEYGWYNTKKEPGLLHYRLIKDRLQVFTLDKEAWKNQKGINDLGNPRDFVIFTKNIDAADVIPLLPQESLSEKMIYTIYALESESKNHRHHPDNFDKETMLPLPKEKREGKWKNFWEVLTYYYEHEDFGQFFESTDKSYGALKWRLRNLIEGDLRKFIREGKEGEKDTFELIRDNLDREYKEDRVIHFLLHFGIYSSREMIYEFVANCLVRKLYYLYTGKTQRMLSDDELKYRKVVILLEEAHKFVGANGMEVFRLIARETRKYGMTVWMVDQKPSTIDETTISQIANRIIGRLNGDDDINIALSGLNRNQWRPIINTLETGQMLVFGEMVDFVPTIIKTFFTKNVGEEERIRNIDKALTVDEIIDSDEIKLTKEEKKGMVKDPHKGDGKIPTKKIKFDGLLMHEVPKPRSKELTPIKKKDIPKKDDIEFGAEADIDDDVIDD